MKFKLWIKNLKVPRLVLEALLVFGSVYFALLLEADRSMDFEREMMIGRMNKMIKIIDKDSSYITNQFLSKKSLVYQNFYVDSLISDMMLKDVDLPDSLLDRLHRAHFGRTEILRTWDVNSQILNFENDFGQLIISEDLLQNLNDYIYFKNSNKYGHNRANEMGDKLMEYMYLEGYPFNKANSEKAKSEFNNSIVFSNYLNDIVSFREFRRTLANLILRDIKIVKVELRNEIQAQEEAMRGIF